MTLVYAFRLKNKICKRSYVGGSTNLFFVHLENVSITTELLKM